MTPEEETALRSQVATAEARVAALCAALDSALTGWAHDGYSDPGRFAGARVVLEHLSVKGDWSPIHDAEDRVVRLALAALEGKTSYVEFDKAIAAHDTRVRAEARADERTRLEEEWNLSVAIASFPKTPSMVEIIETHDVEVRADARRAALELAADAVKHLSHEDGLGMGSQRLESAILSLMEQP